MIAKTQIDIYLVYEGLPYEYDYTAPCYLPDDTALLVAEGLLYEASWAGDTNFDEYTVTVTYLDQNDEPVDV